jgi:O-antigen/teichoic acid export membrane protein
MDGFIISTMLSIKDYAIYRNGAIEIPFLASIYSTISIIIMPEITQLNLDKKITQIYELKRRLSLIMACLIYPIVIFMIVMSSEFITIYLSAKYTESAVIFSLYNLILLLRINDYQDILVILKKSKTIFYSNIFSIVINIILNIVFIKFFGLIGAVVAFLMSVTFLAVLLMVRTLKETQNKVKDYFDLKKIAVILLVCLILSLLVYYLNIQFDNVYFLILLSMLYIISVYLILIKLKLFDFTLLQPILTKIPKGDKIYNIVKRFQSYTLKNKTVKY